MPLSCKFCTNLETRLTQFYQKFKFSTNLAHLQLFRTDFIWARAMGYTGAQLDDGAGVDVGINGREAQEYKYLGGRCRHYKLIGETHGSAGPGHPVTQRIVREMVLGEGK